MADRAIDILGLSSFQNALNYAMDYAAAEELNWLARYFIEKNIHVNLDYAADEVDDLTLSQLALLMILDLNNSYLTYNKVPPGTKEILRLLSMLMAAEDPNSLIANQPFLSEISSAINDVESVKSDSHYVRAGLKIILASLIIATCVSSFPVTPLILCAIFIDATIAILMIKDAVNQIQRTTLVNNPTENKNTFLTSFSLFKDKIGIEDDNVQRNENELVSNA